MAEVTRERVGFSVAGNARKSIGLKQWGSVVERIEFAFQPIFNILTASCVGFEALLRGHVGAGFGSIDSIFDTAHEQGLLPEVTALLMDKKLDEYSASGCAGFAKLFANLDSRVLFDVGRFMPLLAALLDKHKVPASSLVLEISEKFDMEKLLTSEVFNLLKGGGKGIKIALDDYGVNYSGLRLLYYSEPSYIKVDRFFVSGIHSDIKKRIFLSSLVNKAHMLGMLVIAEGVETVEEFYLCKELGCDLVQGYLVQKPDEITKVRGRRSEVVENLNVKDRRSYGSDNRLIFSLMESIRPIVINSSNPVLADANAVLTTFRERKDLTFLPVVNEEGEPTGIILEKKLKDFVYSPYGHSLLRHKGMNVGQFISVSPIFEISTSIEKILEGFSLNRDAEGVIITRGGKYAGFLSAKSLLRVLYDKNISNARDQNPLSKLPGNNLIHNYLAKAVELDDGGLVVSYFDFDNFKPYNDNYGFRKGDKAILIFADMLRGLEAKGAFVGHIGGDDFFAGFRDDLDCFQRSIDLIKETIAGFAVQAAELYSSDERDRRCITSTDRDGNARCVPLLTVSAAVLVIPGGGRNFSMDDISLMLADAKRHAKHSEGKISITTLPGATTMSDG